MKGMNPIVFMTVDTLLLVILKRRLVSITSKTSPAGSMSKIGAAIYSKRSPINDIPNANARSQLE